MITPVRILKVGALCERKNDLLVSVDDIKLIAKEARNKGIDKFAEAICDKVSDDSIQVMLPDGFRADVVTIDYVSEIAVKIAEEMKGEIKP